MKYFTLDEFVCNHCHEGGVSDVVAAMLDEARREAGVAFHLTSAYRCVVHNENVGGVKNSSHVFGLAVDISTPNNHIRARVLIGLIKAGFTRIGIANTFIHVDIDGTKPPISCWLYGDTKHVA
jgi:uncharacterized protein YcbK (DUF882 family)